MTNSIFYLHFVWGKKIRWKRRDEGNGEKYKRKKTRGAHDMGVSSRIISPCGGNEGWDAGTDGLFGYEDRGQETRMEIRARRT